MSINENKPTLKLPPSGSRIDCAVNLVVVGANGSGKSRLGVWLEKNNENTHRISAQRALRFKSNIPLKGRELAERQLRWGNENVEDEQHRDTHRWGRSPANFVLNDFDALLATLFARQRERDNAHSDLVHGLSKSMNVLSPDDVRRPSCEIDQIVDLWGSVFPQRELLITSDAIRARTPGGTEYSGSEMSDGERVAVYLIGQVLCAEARAILILDEPEIHVHRSLMRSLFDRIELLRPDCLFVYITHDADFAATRTGAIKLWQQEWDGAEGWKWQEVTSSGDLPESLLLLLLGSRKPALFVEGDQGSADAAVFTELYPAYIVVPCGSCARVIETAKAYNNTPQLARVMAVGIIDRDRRSNAQVEVLENRGIRVLQVAEVENLFLLEDVVRFVATFLIRDPDIVFRDAQKLVEEALQNEVEVQACELAMARIQEAFDLFGAKGKTKGSILNAYAALASSDLPATHFDGAEKLFNEALTDGDYRAVLKHYNRKNLARRAGKVFGLKTDAAEYPDLVVRILQGKGSDGEELRTIFRRHLPTLP